MSDDVQLSVQLTKLGEFERANTVAKNDKFLAALSSSTQSYSLRSGTIGKYVLNNLENQSEFVPDGQWNFKGPNAMINIPVDPEADNDVPNLKYVYETLISKLDDLSAQLFSDDPEVKLLPSYVGMVVLGDNFSSAIELQKIYGTNTSWKKIEGRFLLGAGSCESNNIENYGDCSSGSVNAPVQGKGGVDKVALEGMPKHTHKFEYCKKFGKFPLNEIDTFPVTAELTEKADKFYSPLYEIDRTKNVTNGHRRYANTIVDVTSKFKPEAIEKTFKWRAEGEIQGNPNKWKNAPRNNIPPYYVTYIWERIK